MGEEEREGEGGKEGPPFLFILECVEEIRKARRRGEGKEGRREEGEEEGRIQREKLERNGRGG